MQEEDIVEEVLDTILSAYDELSKILGTKLNRKVFYELMNEVARISINELARQLLLSSFPEIDDLSDEEYSIVDTLVPAFLEKYVLDKLNIGGRSISEIAEELSVISEDLVVSEELINSLYNEFVNAVRRGELKSFVLTLPSKVLSKAAKT